MIYYRNGAYQVVVNIGLDPDRKRKRIARTVRMPKRKRIPAEVLALEAQLRVQVENQLRDEVAEGIYGGPKITVGELLDKWLAHAGPDLSPTTVHGYGRCIRLYLKPAIGAVRIDKLTAARLDGLYRALRVDGGQGRGLKPATIRQAHAVMRRALDQAMRWEWIEKNAADRASPPSVKASEKLVPSREEIQKLVEEAPEGLGLLIAIAAGTGMRRGELCGLRWSDVDLEAGEIVVRRSAVEIGHKITVKDTKTGTVRRVPIGPKLVATLKARHTEQARIALAFGVTIPHGYVLSETFDASKPLHPNVASDRFRVHSRKLGLAVRLHDLRHAAATHALAAGIPPNDVAAAMGWASTKMLFDTYGHHTPAHRSALAAAIDI